MANIERIFVGEGLRMEDVLPLITKPASLDNEPTVQEQLVDHTSNTEQTVINNLLIEDLVKAAGTLTPIEKTVIYKIFVGEESTIKIGEEIKRTKQGISTIKARALRKMKKAGEEIGLDNYLTT